MGQPLDQLGALLHDRQIGRKAGVEHAVEAQPPQGRGHHADHVGARRHAEFLAERDGNGRGVLATTTFRVVQGVENFLDLALFQAPRWGRR